MINLITLHFVLFFKCIIRQIYYLFDFNISKKYFNIDMISTKINLKLKKYCVILIKMKVSSK